MFDHELKNILSFLKGAQAVLIMGYDGIVVESVTQSNSSDFQDLSIELGQISKNIAEISRNTATGALTEMVLHFEKAKVLIRSIHPEYFIALLMDRNESVGKGQFAVSRVLPALSKNL